MGDRCGGLACFALQELSVAFICKGEFHRLSVVAMAIFSQGKTNLYGLEKFFGTILHGHKVSIMDDEFAVVALKNRFCCSFPARVHILSFVRNILNSNYTEMTTVP
jgi:hypothetical protein